MRTDPLIINMVETAIYAQWLHRNWFIPYYDRWAKGEVDIVGLDDKTQAPKWAVQIKWGNRCFDHPGELKALLQFLLDNDLHSAMVTTLDKEGLEEVDGIRLQFVPAAVYAYMVGRNTLIQKQRRTI